MKISGKSEERFITYMFYGYNLLPLLLFILLDGEFTDGDRMLSDNGARHLPGLIYLMVSLGIAVFFFSFVTLTVRLKTFGVSFGNLLRTLMVFTITTPSAFALAYLAKENPADEGSQCILNFEGHYDALYFSYSALTTLVHGSLAPVGFCRILTSIEALLGYLFLGMLAAMFYQLMVPSNGE